MHVRDAGSELQKVMSDDPGNFLEIGRILTMLQDDLEAASGPDATRQFEGWLNKVGLSKRRAAYWIEIVRAFGELKLPAKRLTTIGWTKLGVIAKHMEPGREEELLTLAENMNVAQLKARVGDRELPTHILAFHLTDRQYKAVAQALIAQGATRTGTDGMNLGGKEEALYRVCKELRKATRGKGSPS